MRLKFYMKRYNVTESQLAQEAGCTQGYISQIANGKRTPSPDMALNISKACERIAAARSDLMPEKVTVLELLYPDTEIAA